MTGGAKSSGLLRWGGVLAPASRGARAMLFAALIVITASLAFAQLGVVGFDNPNGGKTYAVVMLVPVALGALLFGAWRGTLFGLVAGIALLIHSYVQPLDFFEVFFITPLSSCVLFAVTGTVLGVLFALALRRFASGALRVVAIVVTCAVGATLAVTAFRFLSIMVLSGQMILGGSAADIAESLGALWAQTAIDAVLMALVCVAGDAIARYIFNNEGRLGLRTVFRGWLLVIVLVVFSATAGVGYFAITYQEADADSDLMVSETTYLRNQIQAFEERLDALDQTRSNSGLDSEGGLESGPESSAGGAEADMLKSALSLDGLLDGYEEDYDGQVAVVKGDDIILSDTEDFPVGGKLSDIADPSTVEELQLLAQLDEATQILYTDEEEEIGVSSNFSLDVAYMAASSYEDYVILMIRPASMVFAERGGVMMWLTLSALLVLLAVFAASSLLLGRVVARPIDRVNGVLAQVADGDLKARARERSTSELASLAQGVNTTVKALERQIAQVKEGIDRELEAANAIQESALPRVFPPFPDLTRFDIYASMQPAKQVGGDFYDFFLIGEGNTPQGGKLGFLVADVSGKGVPAALFMMAAKASIRSYMESGMELGEAFENANRKLCAGNDAGMFVTAFAGVLDYGSGHVVCVNAGHNAPYLWHGGGWSALKKRSGLPLGLFDGMPYKAYELDCSIGDTLFLYTDGVTEAMNVDETLYGTERLKQVLDRNFDMHPRQLVDAVRHDVASFSEGAEQADDITMMSLEFGVPPEVTATLIVAADVDELPRVTEFVHTELDRRLCPMRAQLQLDIAIEELFVNVAHYAYPDATPDAPGMVRVSYTYSAEPPSIAVEIADEGIPFDPLAKPDAVVPKRIEDVPIGGLGILMAKRSVDEIGYERLDGANIVTIVKKW